ncbi:MAG: hypothetical protein WA892_00565 [Ornithinimicrobium sp.]
MAHQKERGRQKAGAESRAERTPGPGSSASPVRMIVAATVAFVCAVGALWVSGAGVSNWVAGVLIVIGLLAILDLGVGVREKLGDSD